MSPTLIWSGLCLALLYSVFCRSVRVDRTVSLDIRLSLWAMGLAALLGLGAPVYGWQPDIITFAIMSSIVAMQGVTARHWGDRVPEQFIAERFQNRQRRQGDSL